MFTTRYSLFKFAAVLWLLSAANPADAQDLVPVAIKNSAGIAQSVVDAGFPKELSPYLQTADGRLKLLPEDNRCVSRGTVLYLPRTAVTEGTSEKNIAAYRDFIAEENRMLGPPGASVDCGTRAAKYREARSLDKVLSERLLELEKHAESLKKELETLTAQRDAERRARVGHTLEKSRLVTAIWIMGVVALVSAILALVFFRQTRRWQRETELERRRVAA